MTEMADVTIVGGGPIGLFGLYCAGLHHLKARLVERLDRLGGQLEHLYPEKPIYDVGGFPSITGRDLVERLKQQAFQYPAEIMTGLEATDLRPGDNGWNLLTPGGRLPTRTVIITAGIGEFIPRRYQNPAIDAYEGQGLCYVVQELDDFTDQRVLVVGGGDSAADWAMAVAARARHVTMIHRRSGFQCHVDSLAKLETHPRVTLMPNRSLVRVVGDGRVEGAILSDGEGRELPEVFDVQRIIVAIGLIPGTALFRNWNLDMQGDAIAVNTDMSTNLSGVYAAGDMAAYPGKVKLIAAGFGEIATAVEAVKEHLGR